MLGTPVRFLCKRINTKRKQQDALEAEMAKVHTYFTQVEVQILVFKNTLVKVEVLIKLLYSNKSKEGFEMYLKGPCHGHFH